MISAIYDRRSIRKFLDKPVSKKDITEIIQSGMKAPSSKNRQPWKYIVIQGNAREEMLKVFRRGIQREERGGCQAMQDILISDGVQRAPHTDPYANGGALLPQSRQHIAAAKYTVDIMSEAPVIVFVVNSLGKSILEELTPEERVYEICNIQSISASIQNMLLTATDKGIGSLWICDIYFAYSELCEWLASDGELIAAVAFGYPNEFPEERPRKKIEDVVEWRN